MVRADVVPPRLDAAGDAGDHPHPRFGGRLARDAEVAGPDWYIAMLSGASLSQPSSAVHALAGVAVLLEAGVVVAPLVVEHHDVGALADLAQSRKERACAVTDPLFMPDQMQSGPPAARVTRLFSSQTSIRRA